MTLKGVDAAPRKIYLVRWTDILGAERQAITTSEAETDLSHVDPDYDVYAGSVLWEEGTP